MRKLALGIVAVILAATGAWLTAVRLPLMAANAVKPTLGGAKTERGQLVVPILFSTEHPLLDSRGQVDPRGLSSVEFRPTLRESAPVDNGERVPRPDAVRGIYLTGWVAGIPARFNALLELVDTTELNTMVIDIKDDEGTLSTKLPIPLAYQIGSGQMKISDISALLGTLKAHNVYSIARIVTFKDQVLPKKRPDMAIRTASGRVWRDYAGSTWSDPYSRQVWDYNIEVAKQAALLGFSEIQFDYVRFPDVRRGDHPVFPSADDRTKPEVIRDFLAYAKSQLAPYGVKVSADIFGLVSTVKDDMGIGQHLEDLAAVTDYLSPMVYPSHYARGEYGIADPDAVPYETVYLSLRDADRRIDKAKLPTKLVPWLQDFSLRNSYGPAEVRAQIKAAEDVGIHEWYLWNPSNRYTRGALTVKRDTQ